jgi:hypothetical protein
MLDHDGNGVIDLVDIAATINLLREPPFRAGVTDR